MIRQRTLIMRHGTNSLSVLLAFRFKARCGIKLTQDRALLAKSLVRLIFEGASGTDKENLEEVVRSIGRDQVLCGNLVPISLSEDATQILCVVVDEKVSISKPAEEPSVDNGGRYSSVLHSR